MTTAGTVKRYNPMKGFGFITAADGTDVFVHVSKCGGAAPVEGDVVCFDMEQDKKGQMMASNVQGCTGDAAASPALASKGGKGGKGGRPGTGGGTCTGYCKSFDIGRGWGFITMEGGKDVFVHIKECGGGMPVQGDMLQFDCLDAARGNGELRATNVSGCSGVDMGPPNGGKGGKGCKGGKGGFGPMWGCKGGWAMDPYGGGWGGGWAGGFAGWGMDAGWGAKGKGKGKGKGKAW